MPLERAASPPVRPVGILGLGHHVPDRVVTNRDLEARLDTSDEWIRTRTGIVERRQLAPDECTSDLATRAGLRALEDAGLDAADLDLVLVATSTPDMLMPATACLVQERLGARRAGAFDLLVACAGFAYGLACGAQFVASGTFRHVLVVGADAMSRVVDPEDRSTAVLFGDGAGAVVLGEVEPGQGILATLLGSDGSGADFLKVPAGAARRPGGIGSIPRRDFCLQMAGQDVYRFAVQILAEAAAGVVEKAGLALDEVDLFIPHQANIRIIEAARKRLGIPPERLFVNVDRYGNTSCASIPLALSEARDQGRLHPGNLVVTVGFGGGLAWGASALRWVAPRGGRP